MSHTVTIKLADREIDYLLDSALGGSGIWYWANDSMIVRKSHSDGLEPPVDVQSEALTRGYNLRIREADNKTWHVLTLRKMLKGIGMALEAGELDISNHDGPQADLVVQYALFGEVVYG